MWQTANGTRKLEGAERRLFLNGIARMAEGMNDPDFDMMAEVLKHLHHLDRRHAFLSVAHHLVSDTEAPRLFAWNSAVIDEVFDFLRAEVEMEIDSQQRFRDRHTFTRHLVVEAVKEVSLTKGSSAVLPAVESMDIQRWRDLIMYLQIQVLHPSMKYASYHEIADLPPQKAARKLKRWKVDDDYFSAIPPLFTEEIKNALDVFGKDIAEEIHGSWKKYERRSKRKQGI